MLAFLVAAQTFVADRFDKKSDRGATAVEYGIMVAGIAVVIIAIVFLLGDAIGDMFTKITTAINSPTGTTGTTG
jgi:pilus assembly protein Flp/PilA